VNSTALGLFRFQEELARAADAEAVIGGLGSAADLDLVFVDDILVGFGIALAVVHIPAEGLEHGVDEFLAELGLVVVWRGVGVGMFSEAVNEVENIVRGGHEGSP
jgi:hypothetical protein